VAKNNLTTEERRNATSSWSGYLHQGKIGILVALIYINENRDHSGNLNLSDVAQIKLEYENCEDFSIVRNDQLISVHQVKAHNDANATKKFRYSSALQKFDDKGCDENARYLHVVCEIEDWDKSTVKNPKKVQLYKYPDDNLFAPLSGDGIKNMSTDIIKNILPPGARTSAEIEEVYYSLIYLMLQKVSEAHKAGKGSHPILDCSDILALINEPLIGKVYLSKLRCNVVKHVRKYEDILRDAGVAATYWNDLENFIEELVQMSDDEIGNVFKRLHPHSSNLNDYTDCDWIGFEEVFLEMLCNVPGYDGETNTYIKPDASYFPAAISSSARSRTTIARDIYDNPDNTNIMFDGKSIVTKELEGSFDDILNTESDTKNIMKFSSVSFVKAVDAIRALEEVEQ
jgi:hypothetical protein